MSPADVISLRPRSEGSEIVSRFEHARCLGPAGTWPCALPFGHGGDHERFEPEPEASFLTSYVVPNLKEVQRRVDRLIAERNDLLAACNELVDQLEFIGYAEEPCVERARAVIALVESR